MNHALRPPPYDTLREEIGCSGNILEACKTVPEGAGCAVFMSQNNLKPKGWSCTAFPDKKNGYHFLTVIAIQICIMFPVKFLLTKVFTAGGGHILEPHWRQSVIAAGMNMIEIYVAWMEVFFQMFNDPAGTLEKPEFQAILKAIKGVLVKTLNVTLMSKFMLVIGYFWYLMDRLGLYRRKKAKQVRFEPIDVIKGRMETAASKDTTFALTLGGGGAGGGGGGIGGAKGTIIDPKVQNMGVGMRRLFTFGTWSGAAAKLHSDDAFGVVPGASSSSSSVAAGAATTTNEKRKGKTLIHIQKLKAILLWARATKVSPAFFLGGEGDEEGLKKKPRESASIAWEDRDEEEEGAERGDASAGVRGWNVVRKNVLATLSHEAISKIDRKRRIHRDREGFIRDALTLITENTAKLRSLSLNGDNSALPEATSLALRLVKLFDDAADYGHVEQTKEKCEEDAQHMMALVCSAIHSVGAVSPAVWMLSPSPEMVEDAAAASSAVHSAAAEAAVSLLARICVGHAESLNEFRIDDGYAGLAAMLSQENPSPSPRAIADAASIIISGVEISTRAARKIIGAGLVGVLCQHVKRIAEDVYKNFGLAKLKDDPDYADHVSTVLTAFASIKGRERDRDREAAAAAAAAAARLVDNRTRSVAHAIGGAYGLNRLGVERLIRSKCMHTVSEERSRGCARLV